MLFFGMEHVNQHHFFNGQHYSAWKICIRHEIQFAQECPLALQPLPDPVVETAAQLYTREKQENKAMGALARYLGNDVIGLIDGVQTIREVFIVLDQNYATQNVSNALALQSKLDAMHLDFKVDQITFFVEVDRTIAQLAECGVATSDVKRSLRYINTIPMSIRVIRHSLWGLIHMPGFTSVMAKSTIMQELAEMKRNYHSRDNSCRYEGNKIEEKKLSNRGNH